MTQQFDACTHRIGHRGTYAAEIQQVAARLLFTVVHHGEHRARIETERPEQAQRHEHRDVDRVRLEVDLLRPFGFDAEPLAYVKDLRLDGEGAQVDCRDDTGLPAQFILDIVFDMLVV